MIEKTREYFRKFTETRDPGDLEDGLNLARKILESGDESSINVTNDQIFTAEGIITKQLTKLYFESSWENILSAEIESCLNNASKLMDFGTSNSSDIADLYGKVLLRYEDEKSELLIKESELLIKGFKRVAKKYNDKALKRKGNKK